MTGVSRRTVLVGAAATIAGGVLAAVGIQSGLVPGREELYDLLSGDGGPTPTPTPTETEAVVAAGPGPREDGTFRSAARLDASVGWTISYPPGTAPGDSLPVLVVLHGYGDDHLDAFDGLELAGFQADSVAAGGTPFAIASVDGGTSFWHPRTTGEDSQAMVIDEFLPLLAERGLQTGVTDRIALLGWSMGGYGSLLLASKLGSDRITSVVAESPALWTTAAEIPAGVFDGAEDYTARDLHGRQSELDGIRVRIDCGTEDDFLVATLEYVAAFATPPAGEFTAGGHDFDFWRSVAPAQLAFIAEGFAQ